MRALGWKEGVSVIPKIKRIIPRDHFKLYIEFDNGEEVIYDVQEDIDAIEDFQLLKTQQGLFQNFQIDESRTCIFWSDRIDLPSDTLFEYGRKL